MRARRLEGAMLFKTIVPLFVDLHKTSMATAGERRLIALMDMLIPSGPGLQKSVTKHEQSLSRAKQKLE